MENVDNSTFNTLFHSKSSLLKFFKTPQFVLILILLFAFIIRFYNFNTRWGLGGDDARDVMIALQALKLHKLPLIGTFSAAAPFVFGPLYFYILMLSYLLIPAGAVSPWILIGMSGVLTVFIFYQIGKLVGGERFGLITALLSAVSTQLIIESLTVGQHSLTTLFAPLSLWLFLLLFKKKTKRYAFLLGLGLGAAVDVHYQTLNLTLFIPAIIFLPEMKWKDKIISFFLAVIGFFIMMTPILYWDTHQNFANIRNILGYLLIGQDLNNFVPNSWRLFVFQYLPTFWSYVIGGYQIIGFIMSILTILLLLVTFATKKMDRELLVLSGIFALLLLLDRYYDDPRTDFYFLYLNPFIILFSAWTIDYFLSLKKYFSINFIEQKIAWFIGIIFIVGLIFGSMNITVGLMNYNNGIASLRSTENLLQEKYPNQKFYIYDYKSESFHNSSALSFLMGYDGLIDTHGKPIGIGDCYGIGCPNTQTLIITRVRGSLVTDLTKTGYSTKQLAQVGWVPVDQDVMYSDLIGWSQNYPLKSKYTWNDLLQRILRKIRL